MGPRSNLHSRCIGPTSHSHCLRTVQRISSDVAHYMKIYGRLKIGWIPLEVF
jgi:hypothetical protein